MQPLSYLGRTLLLILDCSVVMLAIVFILVSTFFAAIATASETLVSWVFRHGGAKGRAKAGWQQGI